MYRHYHLDQISGEPMADYLYTPSENRWSTENKKWFDIFRGIESYILLWKNRRQSPILLQESGGPLLLKPTFLINTSPENLYDTCDHLSWKRRLELIHLRRTYDDIYDHFPWNRRFELIHLRRTYDIYHTTTSLENDVMKICISRETYDIYDQFPLKPTFLFKHLRRTYDINEN